MHSFDRSSHTSSSSQCSVTSVGDSLSGSVAAGLDVAFFSTEHANAVSAAKSPGIAMERTIEGV
jgi:hypothetical protein